MIKKGQLHRGAAPFRWRPSTSARETPPPNFGRAIGGEANCTSPTDLCRPTPRSKAQALERPPLPHSGRSSASTLLATSYGFGQSCASKQSASLTSSGSEGHVSGCGAPPPPLPVTARQFGEVSEYFRKRQFVKSVALAPLAGRFHRGPSLPFFAEGDGHLARTPSAPPECGDPEGDGQWRLRSLLP